MNKKLIYRTSLQCNIKEFHYEQSCFPFPVLEKKPNRIVQFPQSFCCFWGLFCTKNEEILHPKWTSYTKSYTRNRLYILDISLHGVGNVGFFTKLFLWRMSKRFPKGKNRKLKTSDFFGQKYGGFAPKVRMFVSMKSDVSDFCKFRISRLISASPIENHFVKPDEQGQVYLCYAMARNGRILFQGETNVVPDLPCTSVWWFKDDTSIFSHRLSRMSTDILRKHR